jgi:DNA-binding response OmpR family regulator/anti-sigma regulatory factor (Ser/Thr protein kinase)
MSTILIVEDEQSVRANLIELLENEGYDVLSAKNGKEGYAYAISCEPDLVLSDIRMPVLNGIDMLKKLQNNSSTSMIPFIFLTAKTEMHDMREGMSNGADDYIVKPFQIDDVLNAINSRLKKRDNYLSVIKEFRDTLMKRVPHELRTPLVGILGISGIIKENFESLTKEELLNMAEMINKSGKRLYRRIEKFLIYMELLPEFSYGKTIEQENHFAADADKITKQLLNKAIEFNREEDLSIKLECAELKISEWHYETIINELLENSIKFSPKGSPITIKNRLTEGYYITQVIDFGKEINIVNTDEIRIFNQFGKKSLTEEGMGFGLTIVKKIIDLSCGYLKISRENNVSNIIEFGIPSSQQNNLNG